MAKRSGGRVLVDSLIAHGSDTVFCVPGESFLGAIDAFYSVQDRVRLISCRHESGAGNMAEAYGKLTGRPGIAFVTRGPGAANAAIALHTARQDSTPMILFIGQVGRDMIGREAFQEIDYRRMFGEVTKWVDQVDDPARLPEYVARAYAVAMSGRRGPVALALPEDVLTEMVDVADVAPFAIPEPVPSAGDLERLTGLLDAAERPLLILGGSGWSEQARSDAASFADTFGLPVAVGFRAQDRMDNIHPLYCGELGTSATAKLAERVRSSDLLLVVGERLGEMTTAGYTLVEAPQPRQRLIHVHAGAEELGRVFRPDLAVNAGVGAFFAAAAALKPRLPERWADWARAARVDFEAASTPRPYQGLLNLADCMAAVRERLGADAILTNGAGNYTGWPHRYYLYRGYPTQLGPYSGAMGYGFPAALAAKAVHPNRDVVCFAGDGCFLMAAQEMATAVQYGLNAVVIVLDNGMYGTIRMHQERHYPGRDYATALSNPDLAALARSFGAHGETVRETAEFAPAFNRALDAGKPALLHLLTDPEVISVRSTLTEIRAAAEARSG